MTYNSKDSPCDEGYTSSPSTSKVSCNDILTNSETGRTGSSESSITLTDPSINISNDFNIANRTPGILFSPSGKSSALVSYKSSEKYDINLNRISIAGAEKPENNMLHKVKHDNNISQIVDLHRPIESQYTRNNTKMDISPGGEVRKITSAIYKPNYSTSLVKLGPPNTTPPIKVMDIFKSDSTLINELESKCNALETKLSHRNNAINMKNKELSANKNRLRDVAKMTENLKKSINMIQENLDLVQTEKTKSNKTLKLMHDENVSIKGKIRSLRSEVSESIRKIDIYKSKFNKFRFRLESQNLKIISLNNTIDELSGNLSEEKLKTSSLVQEIGHINQTHSEQMMLLQYQMQSTLLDRLNNSFPEFIKNENSTIQKTLKDINKDVQENLNVNFCHLKNEIKNCNVFNTNYENDFRELCSQLISIRNDVSESLEPLFKQLENKNQVIYSSLKDDILVPNFAAILKNSDIYFNKIENNLANINKAINLSGSIENDYRERLAKIDLHVNDLTISRLEFIDKCQKLEAKNGKLERTISSLETKESKISQKFATTRDSLSSLQCRLDDSIYKIQSLKQQSQVENDRCCKNYESQIQSHKQLNSIIMEERSRMKSEIDNLLGKITELEKYKLDFEKLLDKNNSLLLKIGGSTNDLKKLNEDKLLLQCEMLNQHSKLSEKIKSLNKEIALMRGNLERQEEYKVKLKEKEERLEIEKQNVSSEKARIVLLESKISEFEKVIKEITRMRRIEETKFNNKSIALKIKCEDTKKELAVERSNIKKLEEIEKEKAKTINDLQLQYQRQTAINDEVINNNKQTRLKLESVERSLKESDEKRTSLKIENDELNFKINKLQSQLSKISQNNTTDFKKRKTVASEKQPADEYSFNNIYSPSLEPKCNKFNSRKQKPRKE